MNDLFGRRLAWADGLLARVENGLNFFAGALIFGLMLLGVAQIILRTAFRAPIFGYIDIVEVSMVGFAVLAISFVQRVGGHVRMELLVSRLKGRLHWLAEAVGTGLGIFIVAVLIPYSYRHFERALNFGDSTIDIEIPTWPAKLIVPVALGILLLRLCIQMLGYWRLIVHPERPPVAVPVFKDVEQLAEEEILHAEEDIVHEPPGGRRGAGDGGGAR
jgi:TRAP-type C4-dicarboxylate transport system permease small subunit